MDREAGWAIIDCSFVQLANVTPVRFLKSLSRTCVREGPFLVEFDRCLYNIFVILP